MLIILSRFIFTFFRSSLLDFISGTSKFGPVIFNLVPTSIGRKKKNIEERDSKIMAVADLYVTNVDFLYL